MAKRSSILAALIASFIAALAAASCSSKGDSNPKSSRETFASAIQALVEDKCASCHREGGIAPFPLVTYEQLTSFGQAAKEKVARREMPPWGAFDDETCTVRNKFQGDLSLTQEQIDMFVEWVDGGMPRGNDGARAAARTTLAPTAAGLVDKTDAYDVAVDHEVEAMGKDDIRCFPIDPKIAKDTWVSESLVVPADPKVVHHALVYIDENHEGVAKAGRAGSYPCFGGSELTNPTLLLAWSPGGTSTTYGEDAGLPIPKGSHLVMQVHYHPIATQTTGRMSLELKRLTDKPPRIAGFVLVGNAENATDGPVELLPGPADPPAGPAFFIPSNAKGHTETMELRIPPSIATRLTAVGAHMHWAGVGLKLEVERREAADGQPASECLLNVPKYDFNWQRTYAYDAPLSAAPTLSGGDRLRITCTYDNTRDNRNIARALAERRMSKPPDIRLGGDSLDEMCQAILVFVD
ncbi:MAG: hypothetical protein KF764_19470 [Labilithrix sp.]|nr:hypothetical protein [Labilithrix sp.]